jgi:hypothetical protein
MKYSYNFRSRLALLLLCFTVGLTVNAQVSAYGFSSGAGTYTPITGGATVGTTTSDDQVFVDPAVPAGAGAGATGVGLPIGFTFMFNGNAYDRFAINNNGWIVFGQSSSTPSVNTNSSSGYTAISATSTAPGVLTNRVAAFSRDIQGQAGSEIRYETIGTAPNRTLVVQWTNYRKFAATGDSYNFQIRLYETSNVVQTVYGTMTNNATAATPQIGLRGSVNTDYNNRTTTTNWAATTAGAVNTATVTLSITVFPISGQTFTWSPPVVCSGTPPAGATASSANPVCSGVNFTLSFSGTSGITGLSYQWQSSPDGVTYTNIPAATGTTLTTNQSAATYYQAVITCSASGLTATTAPVNVTMNTPAACICTSTATSSADEDIFNVTLGTLNNSSTCATTGGPGSTLNRYSDYTAIVAAPAVTQGSVYPFSVQIGTCGGNFNNSTRIFIDFNQNGVFTDPGETVYTSAAATAGAHTESGSITVPIGAVLGNTRMRVINVETGTPTSITPCGTYTWGETEDYLINVTAAVACSGTPSPGNTVSTSPSVCSGTSFTLSMSTPPTGISGITYQWQSSPDGITYTNIGGATNVTYSTSQTSATYYQVVVTCSNSGLSGTSTPLQVMMNPFSSCYCTSTATNAADEEILNVTVGPLNNTSTCGTTGGPGSTVGMYSNYTTVVTPANLAISGTYNFSIQVGTCGGNFASGTVIYIDYNQNGSFADPGERIYVTPATTLGPHFVTGSFTVPLTALSGNTRLRVINAEGFSGAGLTPCLTYGFGETEDYLVNIVSLPPNPPTPVQDPSVPTCSAGTQLTVPGSPAAGDAWYWQAIAAGTSTANPVSGPYTVFLNGTYYVRTYNAANNIWSAGSDSVVVSNIPLAATPPAPSAAASPACLSTTISVTAPPAGTAYFWQGTNSTGASSSDNAITPDTITSSGTYYVAAYDSATTCWSLTNSVGVVIETYVPQTPTTTSDSIVICEGIMTAMANAASAGSDSVIVSFGLNLQSPGPATPFTITVPAIPAGATITNTQLQIFTANAINGSWRSEMRVALSGSTTLPATQLSVLASGGVITPDPVITVPNLPLAGGPVTLTLSETFDDGGAGTTDATFANIRLIIRYTLPPSTITWWDAPTGGTMQGSGSPFETIGTAYLPDSNTPGTYTFYAAANSGSCSSGRTPVDVTINPLPLMVLADTAVCSTPYIIDAQNTGSTYIWNTAETTQTISVSTAGLYYVGITTAQGCSAGDSMNLVVNTPPIVNLGADVAFCTGDSILLDAANTGFAFLWNDSTMNQTLTTGVAGNYFVTVTNPMTACFASDTIMVTVNPLPVIALGIDTAICIGDSVILDAGNPGATYSWSNSTTAQTITVNSPGTYFVFVTDAVTTCYSSDTITITQNMLPVVSIGADTSICNGNTLILDAGHPGSTYAWSDSSSSQTLGVTMAGNYSVLVVDANGCKGADSINVSIYAVPVVDLGSDTTQCAGTIMLDAENAGSSFVWNDMSTSQTLTAMSTGTYYVAVTDSNACTSVDSIDVTINPLPPLNLGNDTVQCGGSLTLDAGNPGFMHLWYDSSTGQTLTVYATNTVSVTVTNPITGCMSMDTINITFNQYPIVNLGADTAQCAGSVMLNAGNAGSSFMWNTLATTQTIIASTSGTYIASVTNSGCTASDTVIVTIHALPVMGFPAVAPICLQGGAINLVASPAGGTFSGSVGVAAGMFDPMMSGLGSHAVIYTVTDANSCSNSISQTINVADCTGIEELAGLSGVEIYPNPTQGIFNIRLLNVNAEDLNLSITDLQGKEVYNLNEKNLAGDYNRQISLEGLAKGIYYIKLKTAEDISIKKLIIN